jgi:hypothetical protein
VVENLKARAALRRSIDLSKGSRGRIFLLGLLIFVIQFGLAMLTQAFFIVALINQPGHILPAWMQALQQIVGFFTNTFLGPIWATGIALFYFDQRVRREGYDIEWMMQAAGMAVAPPAAPQAAPLATPSLPAAPGNPFVPAPEPSQDVEFLQARKPTTPESGESQ